MSLRRNLLLAKIVTNLSIKATVTVGRKLTLSVLNPIVKKMTRRLMQVPPTTTSHHLTQIVEMIQIVVQSVKKITKDTVIAGKKPILSAKKMRKENQTQNLRNLVTKKDTQVTVIPGKMLIQNV